MTLLKRSTVKAHRNIYLDKGKEKYNRRIKVDIGIPSTGINEQTEMIVLVPGYGADIDTNVYNKMKREIADTYNLITLQCDYFGNKMMDSKYPDEID